MEKEYFSEYEKDQLKELLAKQKRIQRAEKKEKEFFEMVDQHKEEILARWGIEERGAGDCPLP